MPLNGDPLGRWWIELAGANPGLVDSLRPSMLVVVAYDRDHVAHIAGSAFFVAPEPDFALALTARHVLAEGVVNAQRPRPGYSPSALLIHDAYRIPSIEPTDMKVFSMASKSAVALNTSFVSYNDSLDLASMLLLPQQNEAIAERVSIPLDLDDPPLGATVHLVSQDGMQLTELAPPRASDGKDQRIS